MILNSTHIFDVMGLKFSSVIQTTPNSVALIYTITTFIFFLSLRTGPV